MGGSRLNEEALAQVAELVRTGDTQSAMIGWAMLEVADRTAEAGWDQPAWVWTVRRNLPPEQLADGLRDLGLMAQIMELTQVGPIVGDGGHIAYALHHLAEAIPAEWGDGPMPNFVAWALCYEVWAAAAASDDEAAKASMTADAEAHRLHQRPDRVECRMVLAIDRIGTIYSVLVPRKPAKHLPRGAELHVFRAGEGEASLGGRLPDALRALMDATP